MELAWNAQKNQMSDVKGKEMEQERKGKISNEDIDLDKTKDNYDLVDSDENLYNQVKNRVAALKESGSRVQKNSVVMYSNILTVSAEQAEIWGEEKTDDYFKACYDFFSEEFGRQNVVSAKIHKDETAPHMHLHFIPVNKENGKLQARISMNKAKINYIHDELPKYLQERDFEVERGAGKKEKNIEDIHEYKEIQKLKEEVQKQKKELNKELDEIKIAKMPLLDLSEIDKRKHEKGFINKRIELSVDDFQNLSKMGLENIKLRKNHNQLYNEKEEYKAEFNNLGKYKKKLENKIKELDQEIDNRENKINKMEDDMSLETKRKIVYMDMLKNDFKVNSMSENEFEARLLLRDIDDGEKPRNKKQAQSWKETLEKGRGTQIEPTRLEKAIEKIQEMLERFMEKVIKRSRGPRR
ncbi:MAG: plasmid recombination protein [Carnobacterium sp.]|nr:plasmid recombination protein [Carnobacterium sp.]